MSSPLPGHDDRDVLYSGRPQSLLFILLGLHVLGRDVAVYSGSIIRVLEGLGLSEGATRSTVKRMAGRGLLTRHRRGRRTYIGLTPHGRELLERGREWVWESYRIGDDWDGTWTLVGFSLPDSRRGDRHILRSHLTWEGFGHLQSGVWIAPGRRHIDDIIAALGLEEHINVMTAQATEPTEAADLMHKAFDIPTIAARYHEFLDRWDQQTPLASAPDDLARQLLLYGDWLSLVRHNPVLPAEHLPADWPAVHAQSVFRALTATYEPTAETVAATVLEVVPVTG